MDNLEQTLAIVGTFLSTVATVLGTWWLRIQSRKAKNSENESKVKLVEAERLAAIEIQKANASHAQAKQDRQDVNDEAWILIRRLQDIIREHAEELGKIRTEHETALNDCESREREAIRYTTQLEREVGRMMERIRFYEARLQQLRDWRVPAFEQQPLKVQPGSGNHIPLPPTPPEPES